MKKLLLILLCVPLIFSCQENKEKNDTKKTEEEHNKSYKNIDEIMGKEIEYTIYDTEKKLIEFWNANPNEIDDVVGIYKYLSGKDRSLYKYVLGVIKQNDIYKFILLSGSWEEKDIQSGGVKAIMQNTQEDMYRLRWRMVNIGSEYGVIVNGDVKKDGLTLLFNLNEIEFEFEFVKTYNPLSK